VIEGHLSPWEAPYLVCGDLKPNDENFIDGYNITLFDKERFDEFAELIEGIKEALEKNRRLGRYEDKHLNFRYFDFYSHLYTPLISIDNVGYVLRSRLSVLIAMKSCLLTG